MTIKYPKKIDWSKLDTTDYPNQVVALDVPVVYDECSLHRYYIPIGAKNPTPLPPEFISTEDAFMTFTKTLTSPSTKTATSVISAVVKSAVIKTITASPYPDGKYRSITVTYTINIDVDVATSDSATSPATLSHEIVSYALDRTETRVMYCPTLAVEGTSIWAFDDSTKDAKDSPIFRLMLNNIYLVVSLKGSTPSHSPEFEMSLAYTALLKCEYTVQLLVPSYGFFVASKECSPPVPVPTPTEKGFYPEINFDELIQP